MEEQSPAFAAGSTGGLGHTPPGAPPGPNPRREATCRQPSAGGRKASSGSDSGNGLTDRATEAGREVTSQEPGRGPAQHGPEAPAHTPRQSGLNSDLEEGCMHGPCSSQPYVREEVKLVTLNTASISEGPQGRPGATDPAQVPLPAPLTPPLRTLWNQNRPTCTSNKHDTVSSSSQKAIQGFLFK